MTGKDLDKKVIFSGVQPSGNLHVGNYLGAIKNWVAVLNDARIEKSFFCVVDMHAVTVWQDPKILAAKTREIAAIYLAAGIDPQKSCLFVQSQVSAHAELAWVMNCVARVGWMNRMTQFKEKSSGKDKENVSLGLYAYPSLMAADILLYDATHVPVGEDQKQHVELARDIAIKFNHDFGVDLFTIPEPVIMPEGARVMSLKDGSKKMSKSDANLSAAIFLRDSDDEIAAKIKKATTDSELLPDDVGALRARPEAHNLMTIYAVLSGLGLDAALARFAGQGFAPLKKELTELVIAKLAPMRDRIERYLKDPAQIDAILRAGREEATACATKKLAAVYAAVGFLPRS